MYHLLLNVFLVQDGLFGVEWSFDSPSWCISITMFYYIVFYLVLFVCKKQQYVYYFFAILAVFWFAILLLDYNYPIINSLMARGGTCFSIGVLLYGMNRKIDKKRKIVGVICFSFLIFAYFVIRFTPRYIGNIQGVFILGIIPSIIMSCLCIPFINNILAIYPLRFLGKISIVIYLLHFPTQCMIKDIDLYYGLEFNYSSMSIWLMYVMATILISYLFYYLIQEKKFIRFFYNNNYRNVYCIFCLKV